VKSALAPVLTLLIGVSILLAGQGLQGTLLPVRASLEGFSTIAIGAMGAAYFLGFTLGCLKGGELVKRVGHVRVFAAMTALASAVALLHGLVINPLFWGILRMLTGLCFAVLYLVIESWLNERSSNETRGMVFSTYVFITLTVLAAGQMMTLFADPQGLQLFALASVLVSLAALPVVLSTSPSPELPHAVEIDLRKLWKIAPAGALGCFVTGLANGSFWALAPVFTKSLSSDVSLAAWFMTSAVLGGAAGQAPIGLIADRIGRRNMLFLAAIACGVAATIIVFFVEHLSFVGINLLGAAWGAFAFPLYAISVAHANDYAEIDDYVMISGGLLLLYGAGAIIGPFMASALMTSVGGTGLFLFSASAHFALILYVLHRLRRRRIVDPQSQIAFSDALATAHTASQVYEEEIQYVAEHEDRE
jgi:MFS family permease